MRKILIVIMSLIILISIYGCTASVSCEGGSGHRRGSINIPIGR